MEREEAQKEFRRRKQEGKTTCVDYMIDDIYDVFENRTCENCINYADTEDDGFWCEEFESSFININERPVGFGCNKWESK